MIYSDFLLILKYKEKNEWIGKVFSLCFDDESLFEIITEIKIISPKKTQFSFTIIKGKKFLFSINIMKEKPIIYYWEIHSQLSGKKIE